MTETKLPAWTPVEWARAHWPQRMLTDYLDDAVKRHPDKAAIVDYNSMSRKATTLTYRQLQRIVSRVAVGLSAMGAKKGTIVACQLPNWWQFVALYLACTRLGAIINPLMPIFRQRELRYMLGFAEVEVMVVPQFFRGCDYPAMIAEIRTDLPHLAHLLVIGGDGEDSFERRLLDRRWEEEVDLATLCARHAPSPDDVTQLLYTSGTTGEPKGVLHTSNTLLSILVKYEERLGLGGDDIIFMASPMGHQAGFMYGLMMGPMLGAKLVLQDVWNANQAALLIQDEAVTYTMGSTPFLADLTDSPAVEWADMSSLRTFVSSGAPIPSTLVQRATQRLGARIISAWGMSENGSVTTTVPGDPDDRIFGHRWRCTAGHRGAGGRWRRQSGQKGCRRASAMPRHQHVHWIFSPPRAQSPYLRWMVRHRRSCTHERRRLHPHHWTCKRHNHSRRREYPRRRSRKPALSPSCYPASRDRRRARSATR